MIACLGRHATLVATLVIVTAGFAQRAPAAILINFNLATDQNGGGPVPTAAANNIRNSMNAAVAAFNDWSNYNFTVNVVYNSGVPTADANFQGTIRFGAGSAYHTPAIAWHEMLHIMGSGTYGTYWNFVGGGMWNGQQGIAMTQQYYPGSTLVADNHVHWVSGQNPDLQRAGVHIIGAMRADMGLSNGNRFDLLGDLNDNNSVGLEDYSILVANLHSDVSTLSEVQAYARGDLTGDRRISHADLVTFRAHYLAANGSELGALGVPEPGTILLLAVGLAGVFRLRRRR